jgi:DNA excision repair protein ERCC-1
MTNDGSKNTAEKPGTSNSKKGSNVKSALAAAFAKYSEKIRSQGCDAVNEAGEGTSSTTMEDDKTKN